MYKVFINDVPLFIHSGKGVKVHNINRFKKLHSDEMSPEKLYQITGQNSPEGLVFLWEGDLTQYWNHWKERFINIGAAGGLIIKDDRSFLGIYRLGKWDLPKGKAEGDETPKVTAVREVEEECGIEGVVATDKIMDTYHVYPYKGKYALKCTHWFLMTWNGNGELIPQAEEGIEALRWFSPEEVDDFCADTYGSVEDVVRKVYDPSLSPPGGRD